MGDRRYWVVYGARFLANLGITSHALSSRLIQHGSGIC